MKTSIEKRTVTVQVNRTVTETHAGGRQSWRRVPDGTLTGVVELRIDIDDVIGQLGARALHSKGKRAAGLSGAVEVVVDRNTLRRGGATQTQEAK